MNTDSPLPFCTTFNMISDGCIVFVFVLMGWSLLPDTLRPLKIYCASPFITSQPVLFMWKTIEIGPLGHVRVVEAL